VTVTVGEANYCTPAAWARVAGTSAVCVQAFYFSSSHIALNLFVIVATSCLYNNLIAIVIKLNIFDVLSVIFFWYFDAVNN
jgi:hypothetical protein